MKPLPSEVAFVRAAREGDRRAFAELAAYYQRPLYGFCLSILHSRQDAEDAVQTTFLKALENLVTLRDETRVRSWLFQIARNVCLSELQRKGRLVPLPADDDPVPLADAGPTPVDEVGRAEIRQLFTRLLSQLSPIQREALYLFHYERFSYQEISDIIGVYPVTARKRVFDAVENLRRALQNYRGAL